MNTLFRSITTSSHRNVISQFLLDAEKEINDCEVEMNRLILAMRLLENKKKGLQTTVERCRSLLSPVRRLPTEVLSTIFSFACSVNRLEPYCVPSAFQLSMVCGRWRDIVVSRSSLWSALRIAFAFWEGRFSKLTKLVHTLVERSGSQPLDLELVFAGTTDGMETGISSILRILVQSSARWRHVCLRFPGPTTIFPGHSALQNLQSLDINSVGMISPALYNLFKDSPSLHTLKIDGRTLSDGRFDLPLDSIKTVQIWGGSTPDVLGFVSSFTHLEVLRLLHLRGSNDQNTLSQTLSPTVRSATFSWDTEEDADTSLRYFALPGLKFLTLSGDRKSWTSWANSTTTISNFLTCSACSLTSLSLNRLPISDRQTITLLELIPSLTTLEIEERRLDAPNQMITESFLRRFVVCHQHEVLQSGHIYLPHLTDVTFVMRRNGLIEEDLFDAISSRWIPDPKEVSEVGVACLRSVHITVMKRDARECRLRSLECLRDAGLRLNVARRILL
ncbi:hypothetical protein PM082_010393 [Marasmius tenuissimus]|nr:hypothetical protein PM082_010393 [Marasmius tenuissimus]